VSKRLSRALDFIKIVKKRERGKTFISRRLDGLLLGFNLNKI